MKTKHLIILLIASIASVSLFFFMRQKNISSIRQSHQKIGIPVFPELELEKLTSLKIFSGENLKLDLLKNEELWTVANLYNYPADPSRLRSFTVDISEMKIMKTMNVSEPQLSRFGLDPKDSSMPPLKIEFSSNLAKIAEFQAGKKYTRQSSSEFGGEISEGRFIILPGKNTVLVSDKTLYQLEYEAFDWIDKSFFSADKLKYASFTENGNIIWIVSRNTESEEMKLQNIPEGREVDTSKISEISSSLSFLSFAKIANPTTSDTDTGLDKPKLFSAEDFDGIRYLIRIGKKENNESFVKVSAEFIGISSPTPKEDEKPEEKEKREKEFAEKEKKAKEKVDEINKKYAPWLYLLADYKIKTFSYPLEELLKKNEDKSKEEKQPENDNDIEEEENIPQK